MSGLCLFAKPLDDAVFTTGRRSVTVIRLSLGRAVHRRADACR